MQQMILPSTRQNAPDHESAALQLASDRGGLTGSGKLLDSLGRRAKALQPPTTETLRKARTS